MAKPKKLEEKTCVCEFRIIKDSKQHLSCILDEDDEDSEQYIDDCIETFEDDCYSNNIGDFKVSRYPKITADTKIFEDGNVKDKLEAGLSQGKITIHGVVSTGKTAYETSASLHFVVTKIIVGKDPDEKASDETAKCVICTVNKKIIVFSCKHMCACFDCSHKVTECPVCRNPIKDRTRIYW